MAYLLDANVFIEAKRRYYGLDFCPAFWDWLAESNANGRVFSIEKVGDELRAGVDDLAEWVIQKGEQFFLPPDEATLITQAVQWARGQRFRPGALSMFADDADAIHTATWSSLMRCRARA